MSDTNGHSHGDERTILSVTDANLGVWISNADKNPFEFNILLVEFARMHHFQVNEEVWNADVPIFLTGSPTFEMVTDLGFISQSAVDYLNSMLPDGYYFDFDGGLCLFSEIDA
jgi:hypothetical protein